MLNTFLKYQLNKTTPNKSHCIFWKCFLSFYFLGFYVIRFPHNSQLKTNIVSNSKLRCKFHKNLFIVFFIIIIAADSEVAQFVAIFLVGYNTDPVTKAVLFEIPFGQIFQIGFWKVDVRVDNDLHLLTFKSNVVAQVVYFAVHFDVFNQVFFLLQKNQQNG